MAGSAARRAVTLERARQFWKSKVTAISGDERAKVSPAFAAGFVDQCDRRRADQRGGMFAQQIDLRGEARGEGKIIRIEESHEFTGYFRKGEVARAGGV